MIVNVNVNVRSIHSGLTYILCVPNNTLEFFVGLQGYGGPQENTLWGISKS